MPGSVEENAAELFVNGARKAGLAACVSNGRLKDTPALIRVKSCDASRSDVSRNDVSRNNLSNSGADQ